MRRVPRSDNNFSSAIYETRAEERQQFAASLPHHHYARTNQFPQEDDCLLSKSLKI